MSEFQPFPKIPRLYRDVVITEKLDGTNGCIVISDEGGPSVTAQSRNRTITPDNDNYGFATWVYDNAGALYDNLGVGYHFGEWWGQGIQRGYGLDKKVFSLFNAKRWWPAYVDSILPVECLDVVPILYSGPFQADAINETAEQLRASGSRAARGWMKPEGIVVFHTQAQQLFKVLLENDDQPKGLVA